MRLEKSSLDSIEFFSGLDSSLLDMLRPAIIRALFLSLIESNSVFKSFAA